MSLVFTMWRQTTAVILIIYRSHRIDNVCLFVCFFVCHGGICMARPLAAYMSAIVIPLSYATVM